MEKMLVKTIYQTTNDTDMRRFTVAKDVSYQAFVESLQKIYCTEQSFIIKYKDDEGDLITVSSDEELHCAFLGAKVSDICHIYLFAKPNDCTAEMLCRGAMKAHCAMWRKKMAAIKSDNTEELGGKSCSGGCCKTSTTTPVQEEPRYGFGPHNMMRGHFAGPQRGGRHCGMIHAIHMARQMQGACHGMPATQQASGVGCCGKKCDATPMNRYSLCSARFIKDTTIPKGTRIEPGESFRKTWRFRNDSSVAWPAGTQLLLVSQQQADRFGAPDATAVAQLAQPGEEVEVSIDLVAPTHPGKYVAHFRLADSTGKKFGQRVRVCILVPTATSSDSSDSEQANRVVLTPCGSADDSKEVEAIVSDLGLTMDDAVVQRVVLRSKARFTGPDRISFVRNRLLRRALVVGTITREEMLERKHKHKLL